MARIGSRPATVRSTGGQAARAGMAWDDDSRPAGSVFSAAEWESARSESGFAHTVVIEVHKAAECGLISLDASRVLPILHTDILDGALLIDERLAGHPALHNADGVLEHYTEEFGCWRYRIVHSAQALADDPWIRGARCQTGDLGVRDRLALRSSSPSPRGGGGGG